jgi:hypothetical protein
MSKNNKAGAKEIKDDVGTQDSPTPDVTPTNRKRKYNYSSTCHIDNLDRKEATHTLGLYFSEAVDFDERLTDVANHFRRLVQDYFSLLEQKLPNDDPGKHFLYSGSIEIVRSTDGYFSPSEIWLNLVIPEGCEEIVASHYQAVWKKCVRSSFDGCLSGRAELEEIGNSSEMLGSLIMEDDEVLFRRL